MQSLDRPVEEEVQNNQFFSRVGYHQLQTKQLGPIASNSRFTLASPLLHSFWLCWEPSRSKAGFINCGRNLNCLIIGRESSFHYTVRFRGMAIDYNCLWNEIHLFELNLQLFEMENQKGRHFQKPLSSCCDTMWHKHKEKEGLTNKETVTLLTLFPSTGCQFCTHCRLPLFEIWFSLWVWWTRG